jgi:hypothetical protein
MVEIDPDTFNADIEALTAALEDTADASAQRCARELLSLVLRFHGLGIRRMIDLTGVPRDTDLQRRLEDDPAVAALLALHEISLDASGAERAGPPAHVIQIRRGPGLQNSDQVSGPVHDPTHCEQCGELLGDAHHHTIDVVARILSCCCRACWVLAGTRSDASSRKAVPDRYFAQPRFDVTAAQWDALQLPVDLAFFMKNSAVGRTIAFYPGPAGATESSLPLEAWHDVERANPWIRTAVPDVEAVLVRRPAAPGPAYEAVIVPIDACYDLVGRLRVYWRGFSGGDRARGEIERFFNDSLARAARSTATATEHAR